MEQQSLSIESRENHGKGACRKIRRAGKLPGVLYGLGKVTSITVDPRTIQKHLLSEGGRNRIFTLAGGNADGRSALIKDYMVDPLSRQLLHVDLLEIDTSKKIEVTVKLNLVGKAAGVAEGGTLNIIEREVSVKCLPTSIPQHIDIDVTSLAIGDSIHLQDLKLPEGIEAASATNLTLVTVVPPAKEDAATPSLAPSAEPEVINEKKPAADAAADAKAGDKGKK